MQTTCQKLMGCPASLYLNSLCSHKSNQNCWEKEGGCALRNCDHNCDKCVGSIAADSESKIA